MKDLQARREKLLVDCELIGNLAPDAGKRATFRRLARQLRQMADHIDAEVAVREGEVAAEQRTLQPLDNPFGTRLSPMS